MEATAGSATCVCAASYACIITATSSPHPHTRWMTQDIKTCSSLFRLLNSPSSPLSRPPPHAHSPKIGAWKAHRFWKVRRHWSPVPSGRAGEQNGFHPHPLAGRAGSSLAHTDPASLGVQEALRSPRALLSVRVRTGAAAGWGRDGGGVGAVEKPCQSQPEMAG